MPNKPNPNIAKRPDWDSHDPQIIRLQQIIFSDDFDTTIALLTQKKTNNQFKVIDVSSEDLAFESLEADLSEDLKKFEHIILFGIISEKRAEALNKYMLDQASDFMAIGITLVTNNNHLNKFTFTDNRLGFNSQLIHNVTLDEKKQVFYEQVLKPVLNPEDNNIWSWIISVLSSAKQWVMSILTLIIPNLFAPKNELPAISIEPLITEQHIPNHHQKILDVYSCVLEVSMNNFTIPLEELKKLALDIQSKIIQCPDEDPVTTASNIMKVLIPESYMNLFDQKIKLLSDTNISSTSILKLGLGEIKETESDPSPGMSPG